MFCRVKRAVTSFAVLVFLAGCSQGLAERYPSYDLAVAKISGIDAPVAVRVEDGIVPPGSLCNCPRVFYHDTWVYYYSGRWIYWDGLCWYTYPGLYVYYHRGVPFVYDGPTRSIRKGKLEQQDDRRSATARPTEELDGPHSRVRPVRLIREPARPAFKPVDNRISPMK